jgi:uncharacterized protein (DUF2267 family)
MNEIVQQITQRVGIPEDKARMAVQLVLDHLKSRLPAPLASQLESHLGGDSGQSSADATDRLGSAITGMMGGKKSA